MTTSTTATEPCELVRTIAPGGPARAKRDLVNEVISLRVEPVEVRVADWDDYTAVFKRRGAMTLVHAPETPWQISNVDRVRAGPREGKIVVNVCLEGELLVEQEGRSVLLRAGQAAAIDTLRMSRVSASSKTTHICLTLDRQDLGGAVEALDRPILRIAPTGPVEQMTLDMILGTWKALGHVESEKHHGLDRRLGSLVGECLVAPLTVDALSSTHLLAMVHRAKKIVATRSPDRRFGATELAQAMGVSPRYLALMFQKFSDTPTDYIRRIRLHTAWDMLTNTGCTLSIQDIADRVGIGSAPQFTKAVRAAFQMTPRDIRSLSMI